MEDRTSPPVGRPSPAPVHHDVCVPDVRLLAAPPWEHELFVAGELERIAHVWSLDRGAVASLDTVFDFGGRRLALVTDEAPVVVAGAWARHGVCGYSLTGDLLWQDRARSNVQRLTALSSGRVAVGYATGPARVLDARTGEEIQSLKGTTHVLALTPDASVLVSGSYVRLAGHDLEPTSGRIALPPYAPVVLDAAAGPGQVAISTIDHGVWLVDRAGAHRSVFDVPGGRAPFIAFDTLTGHWQVLTRIDRRDDVRFELVSLTADAEVVARRRLPWVEDAVWLGEGGVLVFENEDGLFALNTNDGVVRPLDVRSPEPGQA